MDGTVAKFAEKKSAASLHWTLLNNEYVSKAQEQESRRKISTNGLSSQYFHWEATRLHINFPHVHSCLKHLYQVLLHGYLIIDDQRQMLHL